MYSLLETNQDLDQFMSSICRYIQIGIYVRGYQDKATRKFKREIAEVTEFYVTSDTNEARHNVIYRKGADGKVIRNNPSPYLIDYLEVQGVFLPKELQNMAGEPYVEQDSIKTNAQINETDTFNNQVQSASNNVNLMNEFTNEDVQKPQSDMAINNNLMSEVNKETIGSTENQQTPAVSNPSVMVTSEKKTENLFE